MSPSWKRSKKPKKKEKKHKEKEREKKKKVEEKVRGQAHLSYQTGVGQGCPGYLPPLPMVCVSCTWREGWQSYHTQVVLPRSRVTRLAWMCGSVGAWTMAEGWSHHWLPARSVCGA